MKKIVYVIAAAALMLGMSSCNKENLASQSVNGAPVECVFNLTGLEASPVTKATGLESDASGIDAEKAVTSLQVFAFGSDGFLAGYGKVADAKTLKLVINSGSGYSFYAIANADDYSTSVAKVADLDALVSDLLGTANGASKFVMVGSLTNQTVSSESKTFSFEVARRAAKVVLRKVTNSLPVASGAISIEGIYLSNVVTNSTLVGDALPATPVWVNQKGDYASLSSYNWFGDKLATAATVANAGTYETAHTFYAAANPTATDSDADTFGARFTRLVIKAKIQGVDYYYPVSFNKELPALTANEYIDITNINIKHLGSTDPEKPVTTDEVTITVTVKDWNKTEKEVEI